MNGRIATRENTLANLVNVDDVWMIERRGSLRLLNKSAEPIRVADKIGAENLERNRPIERCVGCLVNFAHATATQE